MNSELATAVFANKVDAVKDLLTAGVDATKGFLLHSAAHRGHHDVITLLVGAGCDSQQCNLHGEAAVHVAAEQGHHGAVRALLQAGCDVNLRNAKKNTALHIACEFDKTLVVQVLLEYGANPHVANASREAPVTTTVKHLSVASLQLLLQVNANIKIISHGDVIYHLMHPGSSAPKVLALFILLSRAGFFYSRPRAAEPLKFALMDACYQAKKIDSSQKDLILKLIKSPPSLAVICRYNVRRAFKPHCRDKITRLPVSHALHQYLLMSHDE